MIQTLLLLLLAANGATATSTSPRLKLSFHGKQWCCWWCEYKLTEVDRWEEFLHGREMASSGDGERGTNFLISDALGSQPQEHQRDSVGNVFAWNRSWRDRLYNSKQN